MAIYAAEKAQQLGARVVALNDSNGYIYDENGINLDTVKLIKEIQRGRISDYIKHHPHAKYTVAAEEYGQFPVTLLCLVLPRMSLTVKMLKSL